MTGSRWDRFVLDRRRWHFKWLSTFVHSCLVLTFLLLFSPGPKMNTQIVGGEGGIRVNFFEFAGPQGVKRNFATLFQFGVFYCQGLFPWVNDVMNHGFVPTKRFVISVSCFGPKKTKVLFDHFLLLAQMFDSCLKGLDGLSCAGVDIFPSFK